MSLTPGRMDADPYNPKEDLSRLELPVNGRAAIWLGSLPKDFYEEPIYLYFKQFGDVTGVKVARSRRTGNPKGWAFVQFRQKEVAEIVAQATNNYVLGDKVLKCKVLDDEKAMSIKFPKVLRVRPRDPIPVGVRNQNYCTKVGLSKSALDEKNAKAKKFQDFLATHGITDFENVLDTENYDIMCDIATFRDQRIVCEKVLAKRAHFENKDLIKQKAKETKQRFSKRRQDWEKMNASSDEEDDADQKVAIKDSGEKESPPKKKKIEETNSVAITGSDEAAEIPVDELPPKPSLTAEDPSVDDDVQQSPKPKNKSKKKLQSEDSQDIAESLTSASDARPETESGIKKKKKKRPAEPQEVSEIAEETYEVKPKKKKNIIHAQSAPESITSSQDEQTSDVPAVKLKKKTKRIENIGDISEVAESSEKVMKKKKKRIDPQEGVTRAVMKAIRQDEEMHQDFLAREEKKQKKKREKTS